MARFTTYKNSKIATFLSILGSLVIIVAVYAIFNDEPVGGVIALVVGIGLHVLAAFISNRIRKKDAEWKQG